MLQTFQIHVAHTKQLSVIAYYYYFAYHTSSYCTYIFAFQLFVIFFLPFVVDFFFLLYLHFIIFTAIACSTNYSKLLTGISV